MPTYAYRCVICRHEFERFEKMSSPTSTPCPACGERAQRQITGGAGIAVKHGAEPCGDVPTPGGCCGGGMCGMN